MLIVIVIIGILAAALIPRLGSARGRANDVARKADLSQAATAIVAYQIDHGKFPSSWCTAGCSLNVISSDLISAGMNSIPTDPNTSRAFTGINLAVISWWQYGYVSIIKWWISDNGFVLMAGAETEWWANRVHTWTNISNTTTYESIKLCKSFTHTAWSSGVNDGNGNCIYDKTKDQLRYIYLY